MFELKTLSPEAVPRALAKAERYRLLNEPGEAESICLDVLAIEPDNQEVIAMLLLAITDQFDAGATCVNEAWKTVARLKDLSIAGLVVEKPPPMTAAMLSWGVCYGLGLGAGLGLKLQVARCLGIGLVNRLFIGLGRKR